MTLWFRFSAFDPPGDGSGGMGWSGFKRPGNKISQFFQPLNIPRNVVALSEKSHKLRTTTFRLDTAPRHGVTTLHWGITPTNRSHRESVMANHSKQRPFPAAAPHSTGDKPCATKPKAEPVTPGRYNLTRGLAESLLSNGGTKPTGAAVRKATARLLRGKPIKGSWRSWPHEKPIELAA